MSLPLSKSILWYFSSRNCLWIPDTLDTQIRTGPRCRLKCDNSIKINGSICDHGRYCNGLNDWCDNAMWYLYYFEKMKPWMSVVKDTQIISVIEMKQNLLYVTQYYINMTKTQYSCTPPFLKYWMLSGIQKYVYLSNLVKKKNMQFHDFILVIFTV